MVTVMILCVGHTSESHHSSRYCRHVITHKIRPELLCLLSTGKLMTLPAGGGWWVVGGGIKLSALTQKSGQYLDVIKMGLSKNRGREYWLVKISAR